MPPVKVDPSACKNDGSMCFARGHCKQVQCSVCLQWVNPGTMRAPKCPAGDWTAWDPPPEKDYFCAYCHRLSRPAAWCCFCKRLGNGMWHTDERLGKCLSKRHLARQLAFRHLAYQLALQDHRMRKSHQHRHRRVRLPCRRRSLRTRMLKKYRPRRCFQSTAIKRT